MKGKKFLKVNLYIAFSILFLTGAFCGLSKTVHADDDEWNKVYVYTVDNQNIDWVEIYNQQLKNQEANKSANTVSVSSDYQTKKQEAYAKQERERNRSIAFIILVCVPVGIFFAVLKYYLNNPTSSGLSLFGQFTDPDSIDEEPTDLVNISIGESEEEPDNLVNISIGEPEEESDDLVDVVIDEASEKPGIKTEVKEVKAETNKVKEHEIKPEIKEAAPAVTKPVIKEVKAETKKVKEPEIKPEVKENVLGKKQFVDCLKQQTTSYHSEDPFAVCTGDNGVLYLIYYTPNNFATVKVIVEDNGKLKVVHDYRRNWEFFISLDYEYEKDYLRFRMKSTKGNEADFILRPIVKTTINGYEIYYDQTKDFAKISNEYITNYILWIQNNAQFEEDRKKELTNQELKQKVKDLDPVEKNKFVELAKNGKTDEAIKVCNEVTGLGLKDAKRIIDLKLYY